MATTNSGHLYCLYRNHNPSLLSPTSDRTRYLMDFCTFHCLLQQPIPYLKKHSTTKKLNWKQTNHPRCPQIAKVIEDYSPSTKIRMKIIHPHRMVANLAHISYCYVFSEISLDVRRVIMISAWGPMTITPTPHFCQSAFQWQEEATDTKKVLYSHVRAGLRRPII